MERDKFSELAGSIIAYIAEQIELQDVDYKIEVDMIGEILSLKIPQGEYIINRHSAAREVWVASPISGPYHFAYNNGQWKNKNNIELLSMLSEELSGITKIDL